MTEEEAKTKVCCGPPAVAVAVVTTGGAMAGAPVAADNGPLCIASACMAWRLNTRTVMRHKHHGTIIPPGTMYMRGDVETVEVPDGGFCGLAGWPQ